MPRLICGPAIRAGRTIRRLTIRPIQSTYDHWVSAPRRERQLRAERQRLAREQTSEILGRLHDEVWSQFPVTSTILRQMLEEEENDERSP
jgi:hypothetical protein